MFTTILLAMNLRDEVCTTISEPLLAGLHYITLDTPKCTAPHCTALHCTALHCTALHNLTLHYTSLLGQDGLPPLMIAAEEGHTKVVTILLDRGADVNAANKVTP